MVLLRAHGKGHKVVCDVAAITDVFNKLYCQQTVLHQYVVCALLKNDQCMS